MSETGWNVYSNEGKWLCRTYYAANSEDAHKKDSPTRKWQSLWEFLNALYGWLRRESPPTLSAIDQLTDDDAFRHSVSWDSLGYHVELRS